MAVPDMAAKKEAGGLRVKAADGARLGLDGPTAGK